MTSLSIFDEGAPPPCPSPFNLAQYILSAGLQTPDKAALEILSPDGVETLTFAQLRREVLGIAEGLREYGLNSGDRVLLRIGHDKFFPLAFLGAIAAGIVPVPTSADLTRPEVLSIAADLKPALTIFGPGTEEIPDFPHSYLTGQSALDLSKAEPGQFDQASPDRPAYIIYTSGTSGRPLAVVHAHRAIWARRMMWQDWYDLTSNDRVFHAGAFNWTFTLGTGLLDPWSIGATALIARAGTNISEVPDLIARHQASLFAAAPGIYRQILKHELPDFPTLRHCLSAGEKLPQAIRDAWKSRVNREIYEALGMSEVSTFISQKPNVPVHDTSSGRPQTGRRIAVLDAETFYPTLRSTPGILAVHQSDPGLMLGYRNAKDQTASRFSGDWFLTGDIVQMDESGAITYLGRADDIINAGGFRVSPIEVETAFLSFANLLEAAAVAVEVKPGVQLIALAYTSSVELDVADLQAHGERELARYKRPRLFQRLDTLPKGANNKIKRSEVRALFKV